jgi:site-specific DNA recombinase
MKVALYARVSTTKQAEKDLSIPDQLHQMRSYCKQHKHIVVKEYREEGASAIDDKRPVFQEMMGDIINGGVDVEIVLVLTTSRFFRDATAARIWKYNLRKKGIRVIATSQEVSDDPMGDFVEGIFELIDQYESQMNGFHTLRGMKENARRGFFNGSNPPFGYACVHVEDERGNKKSRLGINAEESEIVKRIFSLYVDGHEGEPFGAKRIAQLLNEEGVPARRQAKWSKQRILSILSETTYLGEYVFNRRDAKTRLEKPREEWITIEVDPTVDLDLFEKARRIRSSHGPTRKPGRTTSSPLLLAGLVKCGHCGAAMTLETGKGGSYRYYNCRRFLREGKSVCKGQRIPCGDFEKVILEHMADVVFSEIRVKTIIEEVARAHTNMRQTMSSACDRLKKKLNEIDLKLKRQVDAIEAGAVDLELVGNRIHELREDRELVCKDLQNYQTPKPVPKAIQSPENICSIQNSLKNLFLAPGSPVAKRYIHYLVDEIVVSGVDVNIRGNTTAFLSTLAQKNNVRTGISPVLTLGHEWLLGQDSNL